MNVHLFGFVCLVAGFLDLVMAGWMIPDFPRKWPLVLVLVIGGFPLTWLGWQIVRLAT